MKSLKSAEGYLSIDHRFSPGVPPEVAMKTGFDPKFLGEGRFLESATITCAHCLGVVVKNPMRIRERGYCQKCDRYLCDGCDAKRHAPEYVHASGHAIHDAVADHAAKGSTGSPVELLHKPKIFVP